MTLLQRVARIRREVGVIAWAKTKLQRTAERRRRAGPPARPERFVFIVTYGRTGSTLLQKVLNAMPGVYMGGENHDVVGGLYEAWRNAETLKHIFGQGYQAPDDPWHGALVADPDGFGEGVAEVFVRTILKPPPGTRVAGFKEVRYLTPDLEERLAFMARFFAPALFLINRRAPADVARSKLWRDQDSDKLASDIADFTAATSRYAAAHPDQCIVLDYEHWTTDPDGLRPVYAALGQPFDRAAVAGLLSIQLTHCQ